MKIRFVPPCLTAFVLAAPVLGGNLNPPMGPIAPTMHPLDRIEPRVCINDLPGDATATHIISAPGIYFLARDVVGEPGKHGIRIDSTGLPPGEPVRVIIHGEGRALRGVPGAVNGVHRSAVLTETFTFEMERCELSSWPGDGLHLESVTSLALTNISASGNGGDGIRASTPTQPGTYVFRLTVCDANTNGGNGADLTGRGAGSLVEMVRCRTNGNTLTGCRLINTDGALVECSANENGGDGYFASDDQQCKLWGDLSMTMNNGGDGMHCEDIRALFSGFVSLSNQGDGIEVRSSNPLANQLATLSDSMLANNGGTGLRLTDISASTFRCTVSGNTGDGVLATTTAPAAGGRSKELYQWWLDCSRNGGHGVRCVGMDLTMEHSTCAVNTRSGASVDDGVLHTFVWNSLKNLGNGLESSRSTLRLRGGSLSNNELTGALIRDLRDGSLDGVEASGNGSSGVVVESLAGLACGSLTATECVTNGNTASGMVLSCTTGGMVRRCEASGNGAAGISVSGTGHVVIENVASGNPGGGLLVPIPGNTLATIVDEVGAETNTNPGANYVR